MLQLVAVSCQVSQGSGRTHGSIAGMHEDKHLKGGREGGSEGGIVDLCMEKVMHFYGEGRHHFK